MFLKVGRFRDNTVKAKCAKCFCVLSLSSAKSVSQILVYLLSYLIFHNSNHSHNNPACGTPVIIQPSDLTLFIFQFWEIISEANITTFKCRCYHVFRWGWVLYCFCRGRGITSGVCGRKAQRKQEVGWKTEKASQFYALALIQYFENASSPCFHPFRFYH